MPLKIIVINAAYDLEEFYRGGVSLLKRGTDFPLYLITLSQSCKQRPQMRLRGGNVAANSLITKIPLP